ncbi:VPLPA-CTERM sorting domain-containing protein [uncultured Roseobacter sp.]|uniref:VPLPA-CTERM sorting domain-containing protein n=1 Tax=uncultured Roseobacter sp. TaxID=114847 RepID=UPI00262B8E5F|nr:VPLPA-CTERM sorting domain-containing protein [uncultured Roseobacter sp.]
MTLLKIALFCALTATALPAQSATVTLDLTDNAPAFADNSVNNGDTVRAGDFSLTFQNTQTRGGSVEVDAFGIYLGDIGWELLVSVDLVFGVDTIIDTYSIGLATSSAEFQLSGANGTSGRNDIGSRGTFAFDMGTIPIFLAGETYTLTHNASFAMLRGFGLSSPPSPAAVPLPASLPLLLAGFGAIALLRRRP